jgi:hypothetical protein
MIQALEPCAIRTVSNRLSNPSRTNEATRKHLIKSSIIKSCGRYKSTTEAVRKYPIKPNTQILQTLQLQFRQTPTSTMFRAMFPAFKRAMVASQAKRSLKHKTKKVSSCPLPQDPNRAAGMV